VVLVSKKKTICLIITGHVIIILILGCLLINYNSSEKEEVETKVIFKDPEIARLVREQLNQFDKSLTEKDILKVQKLFINNYEVSVTSLEDISKLTNLKSLNLWKIHIENLDFLENLKDLTSLEIWFSELEDISKLRNMENLEELVLCSNEIEDISVVSNLKNLKKIDLSYNKIRSIRGLEELKLLKEVFLTGNLIKDITPLMSLKEVRTLYIGKNPLVFLYPLEKINWSKIEIIDLTGLSKGALSYLPKDVLKIKGLGLADMQLSNIEFLNKFVNLEYLSINKNKIRDLSPLIYCKKLKIIYGQDNLITSINPLKSLDNLKIINFSNNSIRSIKALENISSLEKIDISNNKIIDKSLLDKFKNNDLIKADKPDSQKGKVY